MILEEIDGDVKVVLNGKALAVGSSIEDSQGPLVGVIGKGKATFRVDPSCTVEVKGVVAAVEDIAPAPVKAAVKAEAAPAVVVTPAVETPSEPTKEA